METATVEPQVEQETGERKSLVDRLWKDVQIRLEANGVSKELINTLIKSVRYVEGTGDETTKRKIGMDLKASCVRNREDGSYTLEVYDRFFERGGVKRSENEQIYVLTHEFSHALTSSGLFSNENIKSMLELGRGVPVNEETAYLKKIKDRVTEGSLSERDYFKEQMAERMTAFLLGERKLSRMLEIQYTTCDQSTRAEVFKDIPEEAFETEEKLEEFVRNNPGNLLIERTKQYWSVFNEAMSEENMENTADSLLENYDADYWDMFDGDYMGQNDTLDQYYGNESPPSTKPNNKGGLFDFVKSIVDFLKSPSNG